MMTEASEDDSAAQKSSVAKSRARTHKAFEVKEKLTRKLERGSWIFDVDKKDLISILDNLPCGIAVLGSSFGTVNFINKAVVSTLGYTLPDVPSTNAMLKQAIPDPKERAEARKQWKEIIKLGGGTKAGQFICADGNMRTFENRSVVLRKNLIVNMWILPRQIYIAM